MPMADRRCGRTISITTQQKGRKTIEQNTCIIQNVGVFIRATWFLFFVPERAFACGACEMLCKQQSELYIPHVPVNFVLVDFWLSGIMRFWRCMKCFAQCLIFARAVESGIFSQYGVASSEMAKKDDMANHKKICQAICSETTNTKKIKKATVWGMLFLTHTKTDTR